jgi:hypothetical protein
VIEKVQGRNYSAYVPDLPGCVAAADTLAETKQLMRGPLVLDECQNCGAPSEELMVVPDFD